MYIHIYIYGSFSVVGGRQNAIRAAAGAAQHRRRSEQISADLPYAFIFIHSFSSSLYVYVYTYFHIRM